jgi:transposase
MDYFIKENEWLCIFSILQKRQDLYVGKEGALRRFIEAVWYITRTGCQWRLLPSYYGHWRSIHKRFKRWSHKGIWGYLFESSQNQPDQENVTIDSTIVRAHACASGYEKGGNDIHALGRSKGGFTRKIHALCDALGNPLKFILTAGQRHDVTQAENLIENVENANVIGDKAYSSKAFIKTLEEKNCISVIPSRSNSKKPRIYDEELYKERHVIECFLGKIKHFRRVFSRFDKDATSYLSFLHFVGALIWMR